MANDYGWADQLHQPILKLGEIQDRIEGLEENIEDLVYEEFKEYCDLKEAAHILMAQGVKAGGKLPANIKLVNDSHFDAFCIDQAAFDVPAYIRAHVNWGGYIDGCRNNSSAISFMGQTWWVA